MDSEDGPGNVIGFRAFTNKTARTRPQGFYNVVVFLKRGEDQNFRIAKLRIITDTAGCFDTVEAGHSDVHQNNVWAKLFGLFHSVVAVIGLTYNVDFRMAVNNANHGLSDQRLIIDYKH